MLLQKFFNFFINFLNTGGFFMWVLFFINIIMFAIIIERFFQIKKSKLLSLSRELLKLDEKTALIKLNYLFSKYHKITEILEIIASISPLIGLLGTVSGMIKIFFVLGQSNIPKMQQLSLGIGEALYTTLYGLIIGIVSLIFYRYFYNKLHSYFIEIEFEIKTRNKLEVNNG